VGKQPKRSVLKGKPQSLTTPADQWRDRGICMTWLRDCQGRNPTYDDLKLYRRIVRALTETLRLMAEDDVAVRKWPTE